METCYEYLGCKETECIMQKSPNAAPCWKVEETLCNNYVRQVVTKGQPGLKKKDACALSRCIYYKAVKENRFR